MDAPAINSHRLGQVMKSALTKLLFALLLLANAAFAADPLPSWNDGPAKQSIISFVEKVTKEAAEKAKEKLEAAGGSVDLR